VILIKRASLANQAGSRNIHDYRMLYSLRQHFWPVLCQKLWHYSNMCIHNDYFVNKLLTFVFQNISIVMHCNSILKKILFLILHLHIITWKRQEQGPLFQVRRGPKEFLKRHCRRQTDVLFPSRPRTISWSRPTFLQFPIFPKRDRHSAVKLHAHTICLGAVNVRTHHEEVSVTWRTRKLTHFRIHAFYLQCPSISSRMQQPHSLYYLLQPFKAQWLTICTTYFNNQYFCILYLCVS
jgi:hypothetical protein